MSDSDIEDNDKAPLMGAMKKTKSFFAKVVGNWIFRVVSDFILPAIFLAGTALAIVIYYSQHPQPKIIQVFNEPRYSVVSSKESIMLGSWVTPSNLPSSPNQEVPKGRKFGFLNNYMNEQSKRARMIIDGVLSPIIESAYTRNGTGYNDLQNDLLRVKTLKDGVLSTCFTCDRNGMNITNLINTIVGSTSGSSMGPFGAITSSSLNTGAINATAVAVSGNTQLNSLSVTGNTDFYGIVTIHGSIVIINGTVTPPPNNQPPGTSPLNSSLSLISLHVFQTATVDGAVLVDSLSITNNVSVYGPLDSHGPVTSYGPVNIIGDTTVGTFSSTTINTNALTSNGLQVNGAGIFTEEVTSRGFRCQNGYSTPGTVNTGTLTVFTVANIGGDVLIRGTLNVPGTTNTGSLYVVDAHITNTGSVGGILTAGSYTTPSTYFAGGNIQAASLTIVNGADTFGPLTAHGGMITTTLQADTVSATSVNAAFVNAGVVNSPKININGQIGLSEANGNLHLGDGSTTLIQQFKNYLFYAYDDLVFVFFLT